MTSIQYINDEFVAEVNGVTISSKNKDYLKRKIAAAQERAPAAIKAVEQFAINDRFTFTEQLVGMVATGQTASAIITGEGGLGKTYTVIKALKAAGMRDITELDVGDIVPDRSSYRIVKGFSTAKGLFKILYENRNSILVFDDCDSILRDPDALNILKGALDSYDKRIVTWNTSFNDDGLPRMFEFKGGIVFVSNRDPSKIDQAVRSRSMNVDLAMTTDQKLERMEHIMTLPEFLPNVPVSFKTDALNVIKENKNIASEISLRTLINVAKIRTTGSKNWAQLAKYMLVN